MKLDPLIQVARVGEEELVETRWSRVEPAETITRRMHVDHRLHFAVDEETIAEHAVEVESVKRDDAGLGIVKMIAKEHRHVEVTVVAGAVAEGRQVETGALVACVVIVEEQVHSGETFVNVLRGEVVHVVVIPERAHRLLNVAADVLVRGVHAREYVWI